MPNRDGLVVGEGAGAVMLEEFESARKRGATILGEVIGFATNNNGGNLIMPDLTGVTQVLKMVLKMHRFLRTGLILSVPTPRPPVSGM